MWMHENREGTTANDEMCTIASDQVSMCLCACVSLCVHDHILVHKYCMHSEWLGVNVNMCGCESVYCTEMTQYGEKEAEDKPTNCL